MRTIEICDYNPLWAKAFEKEKELLIHTLHKSINTVHHIGSTSVIGLSAKPVIDILIETEDINILDKYNKKMEGIGYEVMGEYGISGRRYYRKGGDKRTHHVHAFQTGDENIIRHIAFRDYLKKYSDIASEYSSLKKRAAVLCNNDINKYCDLKDSFIKKHQKIALSIFIDL